MITVDDVIQFAQENAGTTYFTLARQSPFTVCASKTGVRFDLPTGSYYPINRALIEHYIVTYNSAPENGRDKTTIYPSRLRERSYVLRILAEIARDSKARRSPPGDTLNDLEDIPAGCMAPDRAAIHSTRIARDPAIRSFVIKKAAGCCEYCGALGFLMKSGEHYLEAHHIISLASQGKDTTDNVIGLCPAHHREAHYGENADKLETDFLKVMKQRKWQKQPNQSLQCNVSMTSSSTIKAAVRNS